MAVRDRFRPDISLGAIIQIVVLIVGMAIGWAVMDTRSKSNADAIESVKTQIERLPSEIEGKTGRLDERVRTLENNAARSDEKFANLISLLTRLDAKLERIENVLQHK